MLNHKKGRAVLAAGIWLLVVEAVNAAELIADAAGKLTGANNVTVNVGGIDRCYDVTFVDDSCAGIPEFNGCDDTADLQFTNYTDAKSAAQALLDQVFLSTYDDFPGRVLGCEPGTVPELCISAIPYQINPLPGGFFSVDTANETNYSAANGNADHAHGVGGAGTLIDLSISPKSTYAVFTQCAAMPVPEPATRVYLLYGLAGLALASLVGARRKKSS